jgi:membrane associated rhomboid family serine protease
VVSPPETDWKGDDFLYISGFRRSGHQNAQYYLPCGKIAPHRCNHTHINRTATRPSTTLTRYQAMLLIPFDRAVDWSRPPVVTIGLIVINVLLFFVWQGHEDQALARAMTYYQDSGLEKQEVRYYKQYLKEQGDRKADADRSAASVFWSIQTDSGFRQRIDDRRLIAENDPGYTDWVRNRDRLDALLQHVTFLEYGLKPADFTVLSLFSHMFLHAGISHLLGNMFFLFAVGFLVERTIGAWVFLACYLLGGLGSAGLDMLISPERLVPGIGASGAIAGLMGLYAVLYWTRPVRFFYFVVVYFDYVRLPAIVLLPLWIGNELYQIGIHGNSGVNYVAHLGGLCSGALIGLLVRRSLPSFSLEHLDREDQEARFEQSLDQARDLSKQLDYNKALPLLRRLHQEQPQHHETLCLLQQCERLHPDSEDYHRINHEILGLNSKDPANRALVLETFKDYAAHARPKPRLNAGLICRMAPLLIDSGELAQGRPLFRTLLRHQWPCPDATGTLTRLIQALEQRGEDAEAAAYQALLTNVKERR